VVATDGRDHSLEIDALKAAHGVSFEYCPHLPLSRILEALDDRRRYAQLYVAERYPRAGFDLTVTSTPPSRRSRRCRSTLGGRASLSTTRVDAQNRSCARPAHISGAGQPHR
jgi:hypothetical protein